MTATLATLITRVQAQLIDDGTRFTTATVTAAIRAALSRLNKRIPINSKVTITAVADQLSYEVTGALYIADVLLQAASGDNHTPLDYDSFSEDSAVYFRLRSAQAAGTNLLCRYALPHTINGLDSAATSTLTDDQDQVLTDGACMEALIHRAAGITENNKLDQSSPEKYRSIAIPFGNAFEIGLRFYERRQPPHSMRKAAWDDPFHTWQT